MRRFRWLPWLSSSVIVASTSLLGPAALTAEELNESKVKTALMQRFDENRNEKLDAGEARQTRARLKNLLEDKSERELNILTWRDDVRELLQAIDLDGDNRLSIAERDAGRDLLDRLIPAVDPTAPKEREPAKPPADKANKDAERGNESSRRSSRSSGGSYGSSGSRGYGNAMGGGGFGMSGSGGTSNSSSMGTSVGSAIGG